MLVVCLLLAYAHFLEAHVHYTSSGCEKEGPTLTGPWGYLNRKLQFVELLWDLLAMCRFSVVNVLGNEIALPDKLGTSPMAHDGLMETVAGRGSGVP